MVNEITDPKATYLVKKIIINQEKIVTKNIFFISIVTASMDIKRITPPAISKKILPIELGRIRKDIINIQIIVEFLLIV